VQTVFSKSNLRELLSNAARRSSSNVSNSVDDYRHLTKNNSASSIALSVIGGGQSKFIIRDASSGLRTVFRAESFV
jgi:hypothetical protein